MRLRLPAAVRIGAPRIPRAARVLLSVLAGLTLLWPLGVAPAQPAFSPSQDPLAGMRTFHNKGCIKCHAIKGVGGKVGPDLGQIPRPRSFYDLAAAIWNHLPRMVERMRQLGISRPHLDAREAGDVIGFLYTLSYFDPSGDARTGRRLFAEKRCIACHQVGTTGGVVGPNLTFLRQFDSPIFVAATMWNHGPGMMDAMRAKNIERPSFTDTDLRDLIAYLAPASATPAAGRLYVLPGRTEEGRRLFAEKNCVQCHSVGGQGGRVGPDLVGRGVRRSVIEYAAAMWNKAPAMMAEMNRRGIPVPQLAPAEMADIIAYLYSVRYFAGPGNMQNGWTVATYKGCMHCHGVYGERGKPASDLTRAKGLGSPAGVIAALWNHAIVKPPDLDRLKNGWPEFSAEEMADLVTLLQSLGQAR